MKNVDAFISLAQKVIDDEAAGRVNYKTAAEHLATSAHTYPFESNAHPMLYKISDLALEIAEGYRSQPNIDDYWQTIKDAVHRYAAGNWEPTCWVLSAVYGECTEGTLTHSFGVAVRRQNGNTIIETASEELRHAFDTYIQRINTQQTDERYVRNVGALLPEVIGEYKRIDVRASESL